MYSSNSCFHLFQLSAKFVASKSNWAGGLSCVILSVVPAFALACCPSVGVIGFFRTVSVYPVLTPDTMFSCEGIVLISAIKCYINWLVITNVRPFSLTTQTRLLLNNAYCYSGPSLQLGNSESSKSLRQKFVCQIGTLNPHDTNQRFSSD